MKLRALLGVHQPAGGVGERGGDGDGVGTVSQQQDHDPAPRLIIRARRP